MSISLPTYTKRETALLGRGHRIRTIVFTGLRREFRRPAAIVVIAIGVLATTVASMVLLFVASLNPGQTLELSFFFGTASSPAILLFVTLMASVVGSGLIADDLDSNALTLYLSRPITHADYLIAKGFVLVPLVSMVSVLALFVTPLVALLLGMFPLEASIVAMGVGIVMGFLLTAFYTSIALALSSLTKRKSYAAAGVFAVTFGLSIPAEVLSAPGALDNPALLYLSPWQDFLAVARAAYGAPGNPIDWVPALAILLVATVAAALLTYTRMKAVEVVTG